MEKGARLLLETTEQVNSVAKLSGIENEFYFSRLFKKKYAVSPLQYRQEAKS